jgi:hypothetical protein
MTYEATLPGGYDGVQVSYVHPTTNNKTYINYRVLNGSIVEQEAENPNKLEIVGFRNEYQARERALRETKRLIYSRVKMNAKVFEDGIIQVGSVIQMPDIYDSNQQQGYITGRAGNNFDTSEPITFTGSMYVLVTDSLGNPTLRYPARHAATRSTAAATQHSAQHMERRHCAAPVALSHSDSRGTGQSAMDGQQHQTEHR